MFCPECGEPIDPAPFDGRRRARQGWREASRRIAARIRRMIRPARQG